MSEVQKVGRDLCLLVSVECYEVAEAAGPREGGAVGQTLNALKARISLAHSGQHVEYTLRVLYEREAWTLQKRFSEVAALHDVLKHRLPSVPELPAKSAVRQFSREYLDARRESLAAYLQELCKRRDALNCIEVQQFFGLPEHVTAFRQPHPAEPAQAAEVHEANFGIASFVYDPMQGLLLLGATDRSWTSRMDTKITNIKLPWEPMAPNLPSSQMSLWRQSPADPRFEVQFTCRYTGSISCCAMLSASRDKGLCLCGLSDGTVGCHAVGGEPGVSNAGATLPLLRHTAAVAALAVDDAEQWVISASKDNAIMVYDAKRQMLQCEVRTVAPTTVMHLCQAQKRLFCGLQSGRVVVWDTSILPIQQVASIPDGAGDPLASRIAALDFDAGSSTLFTAAANGFVLWAVKSSNLGVWGRKAGQISGIAGKPTAIAWASSSRELLVGFASGAVVIFDVDTAVPSYALQAHSEEITAMLWLDAPRRLLTASSDKTLKIWDFPSLQRSPLDQQPAFAHTVPSVSVSTVGSSRVRAAGSCGQAGADPLLGRPAGGPCSSPLTAGGKPLLATSSAARPPQGVLGGDSEVAPRAGQLRGTAAARATAAGPRSGSGASAAAAPAAPVPVVAPRVAGAKPGASIREDSDDELAGWDT